MDRILVASLDQPTFTFDDNSIEAATVTQAVALVGQELSIDSFAPVVRDKEENELDVSLFLSSDGKAIRLINGQLYALEVTENPEGSPILDIPDGTPVWYYHGNELVGRFYLETVKRLARNRYQLNCVSAVGRLDKMDHGGGLYQTSTFGDVLENLMTVAAEE